MAKKNKESLIEKALKNTEVMDEAFRKLTHIGRVHVHTYEKDGKIIQEIK